MLRLLVPGACLGPGPEPGPGPIGTGPLGSARTGPDKPPVPRNAPAGAYPPPPRNGYEPGGGGAAGAAYRVPTAGATPANCCWLPRMAAAGASVAVVAGLESETAAYWVATASGEGAGADADLPLADWLGGESEDSFESGTLRSDLISTMDVVFKQPLPGSGWSSLTHRSGAPASHVFGPPLLTLISGERRLWLTCKTSAGKRALSRVRVVQESILPSLVSRPAPRRVSCVGRDDPV